MITMKVIPGINEQDFSEVKRKIETVKVIGSDWVELDIGDGKFGTVATWNQPDFLEKLEKPPKIAIHFMVQEPEKYFQEWLRAPVKRFIFHLEASEQPMFIKKTCEEKNIQAGLAITSATANELIFPFLNQFDFFQVLAVRPGRAGQEFDERALSLVSYLRKESPNATIEVDGGVNLETAGKIKGAGAQIITSTSFIFNNPDPEHAYRQLAEV